MDSSADALPAAAHSSSNGAASIEHVFAGLAWVRDLTDASLAAERVHNAFLQVVFSFLPEYDQDDDDDGSAARRFVTAAERQKEEERNRRLREEARRELENLRNEPLSDAGDSGQRSGDEEDQRSEEANLADFETNEFMHWIEAGASDHFAAPRHQIDEEGLRSDLEFKLEQTGLGKTTESAVRATCPERLKEALVEPRVLPDGSVCEFSLQREVYWVLRQLRNAGQPFAHNTRICALASRPLAEIVDEPVVVALGYALQKMTVEHYEPGHLMVYHQTPLHPLLCALLEGSVLTEDARHTIAPASYAYNATTGQRQEPAIGETYVGFDALARHSIGEGDPLWYGDRRERHYAQRKPCFIELGRLLVRLVELNRLFLGLEYRRQRMISSLKDHPDARVQDQRTILNSLVFESAVEADTWLTFVDSLQGLHGTDPYLRIRELGLEDAFEEFSITGLQYQENLRSNTAVTLCLSNAHMNLRDWAANVGRTLARPLDGEQILSLFTKALVSQFSKAPVLASMVFDVFCAEGDLIVSYKRSERSDQIFSLASMFTEHAQYFLELLEMERNDLVKLYFVLDQKLVYDILNLEGLYQRREDTDWWRARDEAMSFVVIRLLEVLPTQVRAQLTANAEYVVSVSSAQRLSTFCSQGPYAATRLQLSDFDGAARLWEPQWNVVEALPATKEAHDVSRVCAVYRGNSGVTAFTFIDEHGSVLGTTRWVDCAVSTVSGRERAVLQAAQLRKLFTQCRPTVVAIGASSTACLPLLRTLENFVREQVHQSTFVDVPVVWASVEVPRYYSVTTYARLELPQTENIVVTSVALARYVQDPLQVLCSLFEGEQTALQLCRTIRISASHDRQLYQRLAWEMSLWVAAVGLWVSDIVFRPNAAATLQFVPGLGPAKARALANAILHSDVPRSRRQVEQLLQPYGAAIVQNAAPVLRVRSPEQCDAELPWHPLDATLIPSQWYTIACMVAKATASSSTLPAEVLLVGLLGMTQEERRAALYRVDVPSAVAKVKASAAALADVGRREVELVVDELIANGRSFARRPYRRLTNVEFMSCITGITYLSSADINALSKGAGAGSGSGSRGTFVVREGDYVTGNITNVQGGSTPGIRLATSRGVTAFIAAVDIRDEAMRVDLLEYIRRSEQLQDWKRHENGDARPLERVEAPVWLRRGALLQGTVRRCVWARCELHLQWCQPREELAVSGDDNGEGETAMPSYGNMERGGASSSVNSLNTAQVEQQVRVFATKMSRHPLFRDVSKNGAADMLRDKEIGESLLRPRTSSVHRVVCEVKVGSNATNHWVISEERRASGQFYYKVEDRVVDRQWEFTDVDDFLCNFVEPMVKLIQSIRAHRRFEDSTEYVQAALDAQREVSGGFAYAFAETESKRHLYQVYSSGGSETYHFPLHITSEFIYIRLPFFHDGKASNKWVPCKSAEKVSETVKNYARAMSKRSNNGEPH
ncbi:Holliday-junction resolvase-like of SPT6/SH2 domain containing protein, putative [Leishmania donovani]|uniref:Holliday-junction resolvase-like of SPT6/SH2 domain containing protein, putative n=1 Tax=Leishmania donovani TaxID=5661 RepID=A0A3Q8IE14_LEIDO|nr:Holliday-junction resolvase-like of SPT6/SH2 domain containing protein, putative [Leishmania donovani]